MTLAVGVLLLLMVAINTNDIIAESTDLGETVPGKRNANVTVSAASKAIAILSRIEGISAIGTATDKSPAKARIALVRALITAERVARTYGTPRCGSLNRRQLSY